ncbi:MAG: MFS transporter [Gemmatimonadales bacterium]|nr:MFS transporter [Gemmatimonadales bacterium]
MPAPAVVPPTVKGLSLVSLWNDVASDMVYPLLPAFVTRTLGGGATLLGALDGAAELTAALMKWLSGRLSDRAGFRRPLILGGYLTAVLVRPLNAVASAAWQVVGFRIVDRLGKGLRTAPRDALIAEVTPPAARGRAFGFHRAADHLGAVAGSLLAWWLLARGADVRDVIGWSLVPGLLAVATLAVVLRPLRQRLADRPVVADTPAVPLRIDWTPVVALALLALARLPEALLILRVQDLGIATVQVPLLWAVLHLIRAGGSYPGGWLSDHLGPRWTVAASAAVFALVTGLLALALSPTAAALAFLLLGLVAGLTEPAERSLVAWLSPRQPGRGFGGYHALTGLAALPAAVTFGALYERAGAAPALLASLALTLLALAWWLLVPLHDAREVHGDR